MAGNGGLSRLIPPIGLLGICQGCLGALRGLFLLEVCLRSVSGMLLAALFLRAWRRPQARRSPRQVAVALCLAKPQASRKAPKALRFNQTVDSICVRSTVDLDQEEKSKLFWQPRDFAEFRRVRSLIGRAYYGVAKRRGVAVDDEFPPEPVLAHESRLGLCLGRQQERAGAHKSYIADVLNEQARQLSLEASTAEGDKDSGERPAAKVLDHELLASVARCAAKRACACALERGARLHQRVLENLEEKLLPSITRCQSASSPRSPMSQEPGREEPPLSARQESALPSGTLKANSRGTDMPSREINRLEVLMLSSEASWKTNTLGYGTDESEDNMASGRRAGTGQAREAAQSSTRGTLRSSGAVGSGQGPGSGSGKSSGSSRGYSACDGSFRSSTASEAGTAEGLRLTEIVS